METSKSTRFYVTVGLAGLCHAHLANAADQLEEVVVTATRQADNVNRVPLSITAMTQRTLDEQGIKNVADLARAVPALSVSGAAGGVASYTLRGIAATGATTATTGVYLDDAPLQRRNTQGAQQLNGTPTPPLFDLERVEVLRGPQGTLYGGSSMGGTLRFITPAPSLTKYSAYVRSEASTMAAGDGSYEMGLALGGPIINDKLGFRASVYEHKVGGYIDFVDPYNNGALRYNNVNSRLDKSGRVAFLWAPSDAAQITLSVFTSNQHEDDGTNTFNLPLNHTVTVPQICYNRVPGALGVPAAVPCPAAGQAVPATMFVRQSQTYGPFDYLGPYKSLNREKSPVTTTLNIPSLTFEYNFPGMTLRSITTAVRDATKGRSYEQTQVATVTGVVTRQGAFYAPGSVEQFTGNTPNLATNFNLLGEFPDYSGYFDTDNSRRGFVQEFRLASAGDARPLSWVSGLYYSNYSTHSLLQNIYPDLNKLSMLELGIPANQRYYETRLLAPGQTCADLNIATGTPTQTVAGACRIGLDLIGPDHNIALVRDQYLRDTEVAAFGEANYWLTPRVRVTGGVRVSRVEFSFNQSYYGPFAGWNVATVANSGITTGSVVETPITPKAGVQYQINESSMVYASATKGFRPGGVNSPLSVAVCSAGLAAVGLTVNDEPATYNSDSLWSYEAGSKLRLLDNRLQINSSIYRVNWSDVQLAVTIPGCATSFIQNAGAVRSQGFDLQAEGRILSGLTATLTLGYDQAEYQTTASGPAPTNGAAATPVVHKGDKVAIPPWTASLSSQYEFALQGQWGGYVRADYRWQSDYLRGFGAGVNSYAPDVQQAASQRVLNARLGARAGGLDVNVFVNNLTNSTDQVANTGGRTGCTPNTDAACTNFTNYIPVFATGYTRPREFGLQVAYRY